jgi:hypothetical protein
MSTSACPRPLIPNTRHRARLANCSVAAAGIPYLAATRRAATTQRSGQSWQPLPRRDGSRRRARKVRSAVFAPLLAKSAVAGWGSSHERQHVGQLAEPAWKTPPKSGDGRFPKAKTEGQAMPTARGREPGRPHGSFRPQSHARRGADEVRHCPRSSHAVQWARSQALGRREGSSSPKKDFSAARHAMSDLGPAWSSALDRTVQRGSPPVTLGYSQP